MSAAVFFAATAAPAQSPLSAIDWLNQTPTVTFDISPNSETPTDVDTTVPDVSVSQLGEEGNDAVGLLPSHVTGLPNSLWEESSAQVLADLITRQSRDSLPAMHALLYTLLLAEANPPFDAGVDDALLLARLDKLMSLGALDQTFALLQRTTPDTAALFARWFDITLLMGQEDLACDALQGAAHLAPSYAARVFCTARAGDWDTAVVTLNSANFLGLLTAEEDALLLRFLDPELFEGEPILVPPEAPTPLTFRLYDAIGEPQPTATLPLPYAHADLRDTAGWKAQLEAAERLTRVGALPESQLYAIYNERKPAASGMVWDRVAAVQRFDRAIKAQDTDAVAASLAGAWSAARSARLEVPFARAYASQLAALNLTGVTQTLARRIMLLSPDYEKAAAVGPKDFLAGLALGKPPRRGTDPKRQAIADAFHTAGVPQNLSNKLARGQLGETILHAMTLLEGGAAGDLQSLTSALATFRAVGLEDTARQAALQVLLLERGF